MDLDNDSARHPSTVSFIILALNEEYYIKNTIKTVLTAVESSSLSSFEIVMVDDGSTDRTGELMDEIAANLQNAKVIHHSTNRGLGSAYMSGIKVSTQEYIMIIAGDNIMPAKSITAIVDSVGKTDMVLPFMSDEKFRAPLRRYGSSGFTWVVNMMSGNRIKYYNGMVVRRSLFEGEVIESTGYSLMAECVLKFLNKSASYIEIGVPHGYPIADKPNSKALRLRNLCNVFISLCRIYSMTRGKR